MYNNKTGQRIPVVRSWQNWKYRVLQNIEWIGIIFYLLDQWHI